MAKRNGEVKALAWKWASDNIKRMVAAPTMKETVTVSPERMAAMHLNITLNCLKEVREYLDTVESNLQLALEYLGD